MQMALDPGVEAIGFLLGTWRGEGEGTWPGAEPFRYTEELVFDHMGRPRLHYAQSSFDVEDGSAVHFERGFFRVTEPGRVGIVLSHQMGAVEVAEGTLNGSVIELASTSVGLLSTAPRITELRRKIVVEGDRLTYDLWMAMEGIPLTHHTTSRFERV